MLLNYPLLRPAVVACGHRDPTKEGGGGGGCAQDKQHAEAVAFLRGLPGPWATGRPTAERLAPLLLAAITDGGWQLDDKLTAKLTENPGGIISYRAVLPTRIEELPRCEQPRAATNDLPEWCGKCAGGWDAAKYNPRHRVIAAGTPCPDCHPDAVSPRAA